MSARQVSEAKILDLHELSTEALRRGPVVVSGLAEPGQVSVLWHENDLYLRRDLEDERQAYGLVRAIATARAHRFCPEGKLTLATD